MVRRSARGGADRSPRRGVLLAGLAAFAAAGACAAAPPREAERAELRPAVEAEAEAGAVADEPLGEALGRAVQAGRLGRFDLTDAALVASGYESRGALRQARAKLEGLVAPVLEALEPVSDPEERGRLLLAALHRKGGLLGAYDARATTLGDVLDRRRYNCVSASVVYNLLAARLGLAASAQLLPTHARSLLRAAKRAKPIIVETTSPDGFDPDGRREASIRAQVSGSLADGARQLVPDEGVLAPTLVLIGTIYVNRGSLVQEGGDLEGAERLFERGEVFAGDAAMRRVLRDQRAALLSQLGADDVLSEDPRRIPRAYRTLRAAAALDPAHPQLRAVVLQNLRAAAERMIHGLAEAKHERPLLELATEASSSGLAPADRAGVRAFALSEVARLRIDANDFDGALAAAEQALAERLGPDDAKLARTLAQNHLSTLRLAALTAAKAGAYPRARALLDKAQRREGLTPAQKAELGEDALRIVHLAGNKLIDEADFEAAAVVYRDGLARAPSDGQSKHNLVAVLERLVLALVARADCAAAAAQLEELRALAPESPFPSRVRVRCLVERADARLAADDFAAAAELLRAARREGPSEPAVAHNLAVALVRWASTLAGAGRCAEAQALVDEARGLGVAQPSRAELSRALGPCRR